MSKTTIAHVERIAPLTDKIIELILTPENFIDYIAGQYLQIFSDNHYLSYSIANAPLGSKKYELHIRHNANNAINNKLFEEIKKKGELTITLPFGDCHVEQVLKNKPVLFIAGGTGFAPIKAMIEQILFNDNSLSFELYWGARSQSDIYLDQQVKQWALHVKKFRYFSLISTKINKNQLTSEVLKQHPDDLINYQVFIAGPFDMVYAIRDILVGQGFPPEQLFSDAFSFE